MYDDSHQFNNMKIHMPSRFSIFLFVFFVHNFSDFFIAALSLKRHFMALEVQT